MKLGIIASAIASCGITLIILCFEWYTNDDGVHLRLSSIMAKVLHLLSGSPQAEPSFRSESTFVLNETVAIYLIGSLGILAGLIAVILGFFSIKKRELAVVSFGAISLGIAPVILLSIQAALVLFLIVGPLAIWYKKTVSETTGRRSEN